MILEIIDEVEDPAREDEDIEPKGPIIWNYFKVAFDQGKSGGAKNLERMSLAIFLIRFSLVAVPLEPLPIFLEGKACSRPEEIKC